MRKLSEKVLLQTGDILHIWGITEAALRKWKKAGCPKEKRGLWDIKKVLEWWLANIYDIKEDTKSLKDVKLKYWTARAQGEEIKVAITRKQLILSEDVKIQWAMRMAEVASGLETLSVRLPALLEGKTQNAMRKIIDQEQRKIRDNFCRTGKFCGDEK